MSLTLEQRGVFRHTLLAEFLPGPRLLADHRDGGQDGPAHRGTDATDTPIGVISLRRRYEPVVGEDVYEVKIDDEFLMSSLFTVVEQELAHLCLARIGHTGEDLHVLVGGLGLGYTLRAALQDERVLQVQVIEAVEAVIDWHRRDLLPETVGLAADPRCELVHGDFFALVASSETPRPSYDVVLLDVDHSPRISFTPATVRSTPPTGWHDWPRFSPRQGSSGCGPTTRRTRASRPFSTRSSSKARHTWSDSPTH